MTAVLVATFERLMKYLDEQQFKPHEKGDIFEEICCWFLKTTPAYHNIISIWRWRELYWGQDTGIDIVAQCRNGDMWAIQAKAIKSTLTKKETDSFLAASVQYKQRMLMSSAHKLSSNAQTMINRQRKVTLVLWNDFGNAGLDWSIWFEKNTWPKRKIIPPPLLPNVLTNKLDERLILKWADGHHKRTGQWPTRKSGEVAESPGEKWSNIDAALNQGLRGLSRGSSLAKILDKHRGVRNLGNLPQLSEEKILEWADEHHKKTGQWPTINSGVIRKTFETWSAINLALRQKGRGLSKDCPDSLAKLLTNHRLRL